MEDINFGNNKYRYPVNFYNGCGSYYLAFDNENKIVASVNFSISMLHDDREVKEYFEKEIKEKGIDARIIEADGSGTTFFARNENDVAGIETKVYSVPKIGGGRHKNIELILK